MLADHALVALAIQAVIGLASGRWWAGAALPCGYFIGRELAQAEYRWIEAFGHGRRAAMPWWGALDARVWTTVDQWADWLGPVLATSLLALAMARRVHSR
jgi:hypothetical protein